MSIEEHQTPPQTQLREYALLLPRLLRLVWRLARDPRVPARSKAVLILLGGYLASPIDLIPDFIPGAGQIDDIVIVAVALDHMLNRIDTAIVKEHWDGDDDVLEVVREVLDLSTSFMPAWLKKRLPG
ncbi:MAG: DUF1232 domain-containing protein [Actinomycetota bacterium]|nr:DUF1232 domain-containing protein [Actinomycetota bacterium]